MAIDVAAGVLLDAQGRVLLARRPQGKVYAGWWEVPGGKFEPGESAHEALVRELREELGLVLLASSAWCVREYHYAHGHVRLHFRRCWRWLGEPHPLEQQQLLWIDPAMDQGESPGPLLPATEPVIEWLKLPPRLDVADPRTACLKLIEALPGDRATVLEELASRSEAPIYLRSGTNWVDWVRLHEEHGAPEARAPAA